MKGIHKSIILLFSFFIVSLSLVAQECASVSVEAFPRNPQIGQYNYFGVRVSLSFTHNQDVTVTGYIHPDADPNTNMVPFELTITAGNLTAETADNFFQTDPTGGAGATITAVTNCPVNEVTATYAGVTIAYEIDNNILRFNSSSDLEAVLAQLDLDYENHNSTYESNYDTSLTSEQMDSVDLLTGFDEFYTFRVFENLFSGWNSKRMEVEAAELTWLANNMTGTDPDDFDLTFDDAENTLFNSNYSLKIGSDVYQLTADGVYINGTLSASANGMYRHIESFAASGTSAVNPLFPFEIAPGESQPSGPFIAGDDNPLMEAPFVSCKSNKKKKARTTIGSDEYKIKVAINSLYVRSSVKGKIVHFKNGKRKRAKMAVFVGGRVYDNSCSSSFLFSDRNPSPNGWKNRKQLKTVRRTHGAIWRTFSGELAASFDSKAGHSGGITLTF